MEKRIKNIIPLVVLLLVYTVPFFFDNRLLNFNSLHRLLFSTLTLILAVILIFYKINYFTIPRFSILLTLILLFILFLFGSSFVNDRYILSVENISLYLDIFIFSYLIFLVSQLYDFEDLIFYIAFAISVICLLVALFGILEYFGINILGLRINSRPGSTLDIRNFASEYSAIAIPYLLVLYFRKKNLFYSIFTIVSALIILVFIFFCRTRSSFVALAVYLIIFTYFVFREKSFFERNLKKVFFTILGIGVISILIGSITAPKMDATRTSLNKTVSSMFKRNRPENSARINYTKTALKIFKNDPLIGIGTGSWFGIYPKYNGVIYRDENTLMTSEINPHNDYLEILSENGLFGFIAFALILLFTGFNLFRESRKRLLYLPVFLSFCGYLLIAMFSFPKSNISAIILFATAIGISYTNKEYEAQKTFVKFSAKTLKIIILSSLAVVLLALAIFGILRYKSEITYVMAMKDKGNNDYKSMLEKIDNINMNIYPVDANSMPVEFYRGVGLLELRNYESALNSFNEALQLTPYNPVIMSNKASAMYLLKDFDNSIKLLNEMSRRYPNFIEPQINLLAIYTNTKQDSLAKMLISDIGERVEDKNEIKNYEIFEKIRKFYNEKDSL